MQINIKNKLIKTTPYADRPDSFNGKIGGFFGIIVLVLFIGGFLYLVITGIPTIGIAFNRFLQVTAKFFNINL